MPDRRAAAFARLFEAVHEGVYIGTIGPAESSTTSANPHLKLILGYPNETPDGEVRPFDPESFVDPQARLPFLQRLKTDPGLSNYLLRLRRADRSAIWVEVTARADSASAADRRLRVEALIRDVSELKRLEDDARSLYHQLLQAEKMSALGQMISCVAHELNNPLATILTWAERLSQRPSLEAGVRRGLETILGESERAARIVRSLLTFARKRETTRTMVDVNQIMRETLVLRAHEQRLTKISVIVALAAGLPQVFADGDQIQQVLLNLVINAEQAMLSAKGRGTLVARTWHDVSRESVVLEINDDGPGIAEELHPKIFEPFFTTKEAGKGTGLGLAVACAIVQEHGGRIGLNSRPGSGASFYVELPVSGRPLWRPGAAARPSSSLRIAASLDAAPNASILVVEDETALATAMTGALSDAGYTVDRAADGEEALEKLRVRTFDLVICDLKMPRVDGKAFHARLSAIAPVLAKNVIFVTGDVAGTEVEKFLEQSGCRWLAKPFRLADLFQAVGKSLSRLPV